MKGNLLHSFNKLKDFMFFNHGGILVERCGNKFKWCGKIFDTIEELDRYRDAPNPGIKVARPVDITPGDGCPHSDQMII